MRSSQPFDLIPPGEVRTVTVAVPGVDLRQNGWQVAYTVTANDLVQTAEQQWSPIRQWNILGPFPNLTGRAYDVDLGPEKQLDTSPVDLRSTYTLDNGAVLAWKTAPTSAAGHLDLNAQFQPNILGCAYAATRTSSAYWSRRARRNDSPSGRLDILKRSGASRPV